jgi:hypothetical protein
MANIESLECLGGLPVPTVWNDLKNLNSLRTDLFIKDAR